MRKKFLDKLAYHISTKPWWFALGILIITIMFGWMMFQLTIQTNFTNMMPQEDPMVQEFDRIMDEFAGSASMIIVAEGDPAKLVEFANRAAPRIEKELPQYVKKVDYKLPRDLIADHALMLMKAKDLENNRALFENPNLVDFLANLNNTFEQEYTGESGGSIEGQEQEQGAVRFMDGIQTFSDELNRALDGGKNANAAASNAADAILFGDNYYRSWDRKMLIMQIVPTFNIMDISADTAATNQSEKIIKEIASEIGVTAGLTGTVPLQRDEIKAIGEDSFTITSIALVLILALFILAFRMIVSPFMAIITLILGIVWALGITWVLIGELNMMTAMMGVILVGIGIDFSIHIIAVYSESRAAGHDVGEAMRATMQKAGLGVVTGGLTTSAAFLTFVTASSKGYQEFGLALGTGIFMTMLGAMTALPTLLVIRERILARVFPNRKPKPPRDISYQSLGKTAGWMAKNPIIGTTILAVLVLFIGWRGMQITWDYNYLNMEPVGLETIILQDKMIEKMDISGDYAYFTATNLEEAFELTEKAKKMKTSGLVRSIVDFLPPESEQIKRQKIVSDIRRKVKTAKIQKQFDKSDFERFTEELIRLEANVMEIQDMANIGGQEKVYLKTGLLVGIVPEDEDQTVKSWQTKLAKVSDDISTGNLSALIRRIENGEHQYLDQLKQFHLGFASAFKPTAIRMANPELVTLETIPKTIKDQYVGKSGDLFLVTVFPKQNVWDQLFLTRFTDELQETSPRATGMPPVFKRLMDIFAEDGKKATKLALIVIFLILVMDFRNIRKAVLAIIPLIFGVLWMLGAMELSGMQITMINVMAVPLIIGIGIDDGVHIIHRYQIEGRREHQTVFASTGRAVLLTSLTTMLGFGSLTFATYRGLGSLGSALFIGVGTCFLATILVIPAVMGWIEKINGKNNE
ncbi:MMPL family transporter [Caldithrix abyssi]|nr:MMPL family transporter [Caldithrix abyssi]